MAHDHDKKCAHPACSCHVSGSEKYCSTRCADEKNMTELACQCGHATCTGQQLRA